MQTRDQQRGRVAFEHVRKAVGSNDPEGYKQYALKLPALIRQSGLAQAIAFVHAKGGEGGASLLRDLSCQMHAFKLLEKEGVAALQEGCLTAGLMEYQRLTREATACLVWYKRFAQSLLDA